jgi:hypothetical protein
MRGNRSVAVVVIAALIASTLIVLLQGAGASAGLTQLQYSGAVAYTPLPKGVLTNADLAFTPLSNTQLSKVRVSTSQAVSDAEKESPSTKYSSVTLTSLGGATDLSTIVPDWSGSKSWIPAPVPSYVVAIDGVFESLGGFAHKMIAVVNAENGRVSETILYN